MIHLPPFLSRISTRLLAFNLLLIFVPLAGFLSLGTYERQLLASLERSLVQQARVLAAVLEGSRNLAGDAERVLVALRQRSEARLRVLDAEGRLLVDSARLGPRAGEGARTTGAGSGARISGAGGSPRADEERPTEETFLYRLASFPIRLWRRYLRPPRPPLESDEYYAGAAVLAGREVQDALAGGYGAVTRVSTRGQRSVTLYSAIPIQRGGSAAGAVLASQSTYRILVDLYALRLDLFAVFLYSLAAALALSLLAAATVTVPVRRLAAQARSILDRRGRLSGRFAPLGRRDEIGELSRSLGRLSADLERRVGLLESFAADVAHELRNPLASVRSAAELAIASTDAEEREALLTGVLKEVARMELLVAGVREVSLLDSGAAPEEEQLVDVREAAERVVEAFRLRTPSARGAAGVSFAVRGGPLLVRMSGVRLAQAIENLVDNAAGFSPPGGQVSVEVSADGASAVLLTVTDEGPGIPEDLRERVFDRFFSLRPAVEGPAHVGLGLSIVKAIVEGCGGSVRAADGLATGARIEVRLPLAGSSLSFGPDSRSLT